jgi:hypothetical protein
MKKKKRKSLDAVYLRQILSNLGTFASTLPTALLCAVRSVQFYTHGTNWSVPHQKLHIYYRQGCSRRYMPVRVHTHTHTVRNTHQYNPPVTPRYSRVVSSFYILGIKFVPSSTYAVTSISTLM